MAPFERAMVFSYWTGP